MARGMDLRLRRVAARVSIVELAAALGKSRQTVRRYEQLEFVGPDVVADYVRALEPFEAERGAPAA